jgi:hypothetical protein
VSPLSLAWVDEVEHHVRPRLFTGAAWATLSEQQRELIHRQRLAVVEQLRLDHETRYATGYGRADDLALALTIRDTER